MVEHLLAHLLALYKALALVSSTVKAGSTLLAPGQRAGRPVKGQARWASQDAIMALLYRV